MPVWRACLEQHYLDKYVTLVFVIIKTKYKYATLRMNDANFACELETGMYGDTDMLQFIKYLCQNKNNCLFFELKITTIINHLIRIYLL